MRGISVQEKRMKKQRQKPMCKKECKNGKGHIYYVKKVMTGNIAVFKL